MNDNDDIAEILNQESLTLRNTYEEFFVAELVQAQNKDMKTIVLEPNCGGQAVGIMTATTLYDMDFVNREYNLQPFNYLLKHNAHELSDASKVSQHQDFPVVDPETTQTEHGTTADAEPSILESATKAIVRPTEELVASKLRTFLPLISPKGAALISNQSWTQAAEGRHCLPLGSH